MEVDDKKTPSPSKRAPQGGKEYCDYYKIIDRKTSDTEVTDTVPPELPKKQPPGKQPKDTQKDGKS